MFCSRQATWQWWNLLINCKANSLRAILLFILLFLVSSPIFVHCLYAFYLSSFKLAEIFSTFVHQNLPTFSSLLKVHIVVEWERNSSSMSYWPPFVTSQPKCCRFLCGWSLLISSPYFIRCYPFSLRTFIISIETISSLSINITEHGHK